MRSAHDCSDGGLAVTLAECCFDTGGIGAEVSIDAPPTVARERDLNDAAALFGESASRVVVSVAPEELTRVLERAAAAKVSRARSSVRPAATGCGSRWRGRS